MPGSFSILITDRNKHIRNFLERELQAEGYNVHTAARFSEVLNILKSQLHFHLIILDLDMSDANEYPNMIMKILEIRPELPAIIHCFNEYVEFFEFSSNIHFVEKKAGSIDVLKEITKNYKRVTCY